MKQILYVLDYTMHLLQKCSFKKWLSIVESVHMHVYIKNSNMLTLVPG